MLLKAKRLRSDAELLELLAHLTALREGLSLRIPEAEGEQAQRLRLADIGMEDYAFALLSEAANRFEFDQVPIANDAPHPNLPEGNQPVEQGQRPLLG